MLLENTEQCNESEQDPLDFLKYGFYINLKERFDRKENVLVNFKSLDIPTLEMIHIDAKKHHYGAIGCFLSHIHCLHKAKEIGYDHILICEDDIQFTNVNVLKKQLRKIIQNIKKWDVILLASNIISIEKIMNVKYCARVTRGMCATGYIVKSHYYDKLLRLTFFPIHNKYFDEQCNIRRKPLIDFILMFGNNSSISNEMIEDYICVKN
jgi:GR25 family glycosyltransferase involved in LPS biosynthesis